MVNELSYDAIAYAQDRFTSQNLKERLDKVFQDLAPLFDRIDQDEVQRLMEASQIRNESIVRVSLALQIYYGLPIELTLGDLEFEQKRRTIAGVTIPDIPTFHLQFAITEGSWVKLLRGELREFIIDKRTKLNKVEKDLFIAKEFSSDSAAVHVVEQKILEQNYISPLLKYWRENHPSSSYEDAALAILASLHKRKIEEIGPIFQAARQYFYHILSKFEQLFERPQHSSWVERSIAQIRRWRELIDESPESLEITSQVVIAGIPRTGMNLLLALQKGGKEAEEVRNVAAKANVDTSLLFEIKALYELDMPPRQWREEVDNALKTRIEALRHTSNPAEEAKNLVFALLNASGKVPEEKVYQEIDEFEYGIEILKRDIQEKYDFIIALTHFLEQFIESVLDRYWFRS